MLEMIGLGALAGLLPVYLGIVTALFAIRLTSRSTEGLLMGIAMGILVYLFFDLMHEAVELTGSRDPLSWGVLLGSLFVSFVGLVGLEQSQLRGKVSFGQFLTLPYMIAVGMGLHNLGEGLAIGASYANGEWVLSGLLVTGFAIHNGTEGFGIIGAAGRKTLDWKDIVLLGLIAGLPTSLGTVLSGGGTTPYATIVFFTLAAGSLLYVVLSLVTIAYTATRRLQVALGVFLGISFMYVSGMVLTLVSGIRS